MTKALRKAIMRRSELEVNILKTRLMKIKQDSKNKKFFAVNFTRKKEKRFTQI